ncbi:uncharacterized protein Z518_10537 [Rhinocladiella mackenziei CBS 650.93]|uniref:Xylanolytic transcriptional activator regulatory domain-containing protein n=1 Tax=Rhinocladiella mackenziei CBS 650.93 TaxID=1442369 RepID=A0A0D2GPY1_9EURO|nr:uncharacterized protein Z518_10537 [Rhinocladiella mackenziei CBS 650.93]KIX00398.1 hypothetical protein Z518_10537 [Rhinocladiella mackenziei CBS 650.93]
MRMVQDILDFGTAWIDFTALDAFNQLAASGIKTQIFFEGRGAGNSALSRYCLLPDAQLPHRHLDHTLRDKILALVLSTCNREAFDDVASSFPSPELLNSLMEYYLTIHFAQVDSWLHLPTFEIGKQGVELILMIISAGAAACLTTEMRRLGLALQEVVRQALVQKFEENNGLPEDLASLQAFVLQLQVGLWSGDKRKIQIAESSVQPLITMLRRSGRFRRSTSFPSPPTLDDSHKILEFKWRQWAHTESYKRLACRLLIYDAESSIALQVPPLLSPTEITLELPCSRELWCANNAQEWRSLYLRQGNSVQDRGLSVSQCISSVSQLRHQPNLDIAYSTTVVVYSSWALVWNHAQLNSLIRSQPQHQALSEVSMSSSRDRGLPRLLEQLRITFADWNELFPPEMSLVLERTLLDLYISFEQIRLFAGREGEEKARRAWSVLRQWASSSCARKAVWHAGQVLRAASRCREYLREFQAICLYHAGISFWTYALASTSASPKDSEPVWLDGNQCPAVEKFIALNHGSPVISDYTREPMSNNVAVHISNPKAVMDMCIQLLRKNFPEETNRTGLPLVENLSRLMYDLGNAAQMLLYKNPTGSKEPHIREPSKLRTWMKSEAEWSADRKA